VLSHEKATFLPNSSPDRIDRDGELLGFPRPLRSAKGLGEGQVEALEEDHVVRRPIRSRLLDLLLPGCVAGRDVGSRQDDLVSRGRDYDSLDFLWLLLPLYRDD